jgi:hypothetical protein
MSVAHDDHRNRVHFATAEPVMPEYIASFTTRGGRSIEFTLVSVYDGGARPPAPTRCSATAPRPTASNT